MVVKNLRDWRTEEPHVIQKKCALKIRSITCLSTSLDLINGGVYSFMKHVSLTQENWTFKKANVCTSHIDILYGI